MLFCGGEIGIRTLVGGLLQTRFPDVALLLYVRAVGYACHTSRIIATSPKLFPSVRVSHLASLHRSATKTTSLITAVSHKAEYRCYVPRGMHFYLVRTNTRLPERRAENTHQEFFIFTLLLLPFICVIFFML